MSVIIPKTDKEYQQWINDNLVGFVINTNKTPSSKYMILHTNKCLSITELSISATDGAFTKNSYIKVCANSIKDLEKWLSDNDLTLSKECQKCNPKDPLILSEYEAGDLMGKFNKTKGKNYPKQKLLDNREFIISLIRKGVSPKEAFDKVTE
jgi:hypothetical protein